jgi:tetratricopeptide (TPR) repeat protein
VTSPAPPDEPKLYGGKYRLIREIGRGGMGSVWEAIEESLDRTVAVKRLPPGGVAGGSLEARQRFRREVSAAARLTHPGVAQVLGFGTTDDGEHYIAMELVVGDDLRRELKRTTRAKDVMALFDQILAVLSYAHARGVVHGDLKPENVLVTRVGAAPLCKLLDFGVARVENKRTSAPPPPPETDEVVYGTPRYMAPEQARGSAVGPTADLYAVGVMLFEALAGGTPIPGRGEIVLARKLRESAPPLLKTRFGDSSPELMRLMERLLDRDPEARPSSAADVRAELARCPEAEHAAVSVAAPVSVRPSDAPETLRISKAATGLDPTRNLPFVGRKGERARLADALEQVSRTGDARLVLVEGGTGIGKSHLLDWFVRQVREEGGRTVVAGAYMETGGAEGDALRAVIERQLGASGLGRQEVRRAVTRFLERHGGGDEAEADALTNLLRPEAPGESLDEGRRSHALALIERTFRRMAAARPLVVVLDDLAAGGRPAIEALSFFLAMWRQEPARVLLAVGVTSPLDERDVRHAYRKLLAHEGAQVVRLMLEPLSTDHVSQLVAAVLGDRGVSQVPWLSGRAAGNPLFAIQLARLAREAAPPEPLDDTADDEPAATGAPATRGLRDSLLPASVQQLLEARVDAAVSRAGDPETATHTLIQLAVLLPPVPTTLVERALAEDGVSVAAAQAALDRLVETGILREVLRGGVEAIAFSHPLIGDVLRARLSQRTLRARSAQALALKETYYAEQPDAVVHELAEHAYDAGLGERARQLGLLAAQQALAAGRYGEAVHLVSRLIAGERTRPSDAKTEIALLASRIADEAGDARFAEGALALASGVDDAAGMEAALALARLHARSGRLTEADHALARADGIARMLDERGQPPHARLRAEALRLRASIARRQGHFGEAIAMLELVLATDPSLSAAAARLVHDNLAWSRHQAGDATGALDAAERALELATPGVGRGWALRTLAVIGRDALPLGERRRHLEEALAIARSVGALRLLASALTHLGDLERAAGVERAAAACFRQVIQIGGDYVDHEDLCESRANLAMILVEHGSATEAAVVLAGRVERRSSWEAALRLVAAAARAAAGQVEEAAAESLAVRAARDEVPGSWGVARAAELLAAAMHDTNRTELAEWLTEVAVSAWTRIGQRDASARLRAEITETTLVELTMPSDPPPGFFE